MKSLTVSISEQNIYLYQLIFSEKAKIKYSHDCFETQEPRENYLKFCLSKIVAFSQWTHAGIVEL